MKKATAIILIIVIALTLSSCARQSPAADGVPEDDPANGSSNTISGGTPVPQPDTTPQSIPESNMTNITIAVGSSAFSAKLYNNDSARALLEKFPLPLDMSELNGNEKYSRLSDRLPTDSQQEGNIKAGDLMLYGSDYLVLFYKSFSTSYSYTKLGYVEDASGLAAALGSGSVDVLFTVNE